MSVDETSDVIAHRRLFAGDTPVLVSIGRPVPDEDDYSCQYSISIGNQRKVGKVLGSDGVQVLQLVMVRISGELVEASRRLGEEISWFRDEPGETGFPKP